MSPTLTGTLVIMAVVGLAVAPDLARADGQPVISLEPTQLGRLPATIYMDGSTPSTVLYSDRASPVTTLPVRRVTGGGEDLQIEYDTMATPRPVVTMPVQRVVSDGENVRIEYDEAAGARAPHTMPNVGGGHNAALWNLRDLPASVR